MVPRLKLSERAKTSSPNQVKIQQIYYTYKNNDRQILFTEEYVLTKYIACYNQSIQKIFGKQILFVEFFQQKNISEKLKKIFGNKVISGGIFES